jgi:hypothetical protein
MEATPAYIFGKEKIASAIKNTLGPVRILIILKDPVERLVSFYKRKKATLQLDAGITFREYVDRCLAKSPQELSKPENQLYTGISLGYYDEYIEPWIQIFGKDLKIVFFDDLVTDPEKFMEGICDWLGVDPTFYSGYSFTIKNRSLEYRNAPLQKLAVKANLAGKQFWRKNPILKEKLLSLYYRFNGKPFAKEALDPDVIDFLRSHFAMHNARLYQLLKECGMTDMPQWLLVSEPAEV